MWGCEVKIQAGLCPLPPGAGRRRRSAGSRTAFRLNSPFPSGARAGNLNNPRPPTVRSEAVCAPLGPHHTHSDYLPWHRHFLGVAWLPEKGPPVGQFSPWILIVLNGWCSTNRLQIIDQNLHHNSKWLPILLMTEIARFRQFWQIQWVEGSVLSGYS